MRVMLGQMQSEHAAADHYYQYELRAHHLQLQLNNLTDDVQRNLVYGHAPAPDGSAKA